MKFPAGSKRPILPMPNKGEESIGEEGGVEIPEGTSPLPEAAFSNPDINHATDVGTAGGALVTTLGGGCGMRPGNRNRNDVHYTGYNPGTHRRDNGNWNARKRHWLDCSI